MAALDLSKILLPDLCVYCLQPKCNVTHVINIQGVFDIYKNKVTIFFQVEANFLMAT